MVARAFTAQGEEDSQHIGCGGNVSFQRTLLRPPPVGEGFAPSVGTWTEMDEALSRNKTLLSL